MKDILIGFSLMWCVPCSFILVQEVRHLWEEVKYLNDKLEENNDK